MSGFARKMRRKNRFNTIGRGSAAGSPQLVRRMPEVGEKFVLGGTDWVSPALFELEGYTDDGRAIIRFAKPEEVQKPKAAITPDLPGLPVGEA